MTKKYSLDFVNNGEPFEITTWTAEKHENALDKLIKKTSKWDDEKRDKEFKYYVIHEGLLEVDPNCKMEDIKKMNIDDLTALYYAIYYAGKKGILFQEGEKKTPTNKNKKSIGKKN
jgi:hypothetical protein